jgi:hypothetical protein
MKRGAFSRQELAFLIGMPLAWAVLLLFHPGGEGDTIYQDIQDKVTTWMVVHVGMMIFIPLFALAVFVLLRGLESTAAQVSRIAIVIYAVLYGTYETLQGIANGILAEQVNDLPESERATGSELIQDFAENAFARDFGVLSAPGGLAALIAMLAAGIALRREAAAPTSVLALLGFCGVLIGAHPPPFGPIALAFFIAAVLLFQRSRTAEPTPAAVG